MKMSKRTLSALLLVGAISSAACGDDDDSTPNPMPGPLPDGGAQQPADAGGTPGTMADATTPAPDATTPQADTGVTMATTCPPPTVDTGTACTLTFPQTAPLTQDLTLSPVAGKLGYVLSGGVFVGEDVGGEPAPAAGKAQVTLTITAGTTIIGESPLSFLLINRGSKIVAEGTATSPVVFTSAEAATGAAGAPGQWGGLVINGRSLSNQGISVNGEAETGVYGGTDPADNSGVLRYVRLEWTGGKINDKNELNGIAFQGVGNGTVVEYVHVHGGDDDSFEWFGGTVNAKYLLATAPGDDGLDWTDGFTGKIQYAIVQQWPRVSSSDPNGIEADNRDQTPLAMPISNPTLANISLIGSPTVAAGYGVRLRRGTQAKIYNAIITSFGKACIYVDGADSQGYVGNQLVMSNSLVSCATNYEATAMAPSQMLVEAPAGMNMVVPVGTALLTDPTNTATPNFTPAAGSPAATGGATPAGDAFFTPETAIGGVGATDWTAGAWIKITPFT